MAHRYFGRNRNAGYGYSVVERGRRQLAFWCLGHGMPRLGYLIDFDRDRYLEEYVEVMGEGVEGDESPS